jgi:hypothetical protein
LCIRNPALAGNGCYIGIIPQKFGLIYKYIWYYLNAVSIKTAQDDFMGNQPASYFSSDIQHIQDGYFYCI